jgi:antitoxin component of MazEF toxin-antitoxin module
MVININLDYGNRKIQKVRYSFLISLPAQWIKNMKLSKGDSLKIETQDDKSLRMTPVPQAHQDSEGTEGATPTN